MNKKEMHDYYYSKDFLARFIHCSHPNTHCYIDFKGDVRPHVRCTNTVLGNIHEQPFMSIWKGEKFMNFRKALNKKPFKECARCCGITTDRTQ